MANPASSKQAVDYLSSLPPELLDMIFDHAYSLDDFPVGPLSKRLLPFYYQGIYRRWELWPDDIGVNSVDGAIVRLQGNPVPVMNYIRELWVREEAESSIFFGISTLLNLSTRLTSLHLGYYASQTFVDGIHVANLVNLTTLVYVAPVHTKPNPEWIDEDDEETECIIWCSDSIRYLQHLPALTHLSLLQWHSVDDDDYATEEDFTFDKIVSLEVQGPGSLESDLDADIFVHCPRLRHLKLLGRYLDRFAEDAWLDDYDEVIPILPLDLVTLSISTPCNAGVTDDSCAVDRDFPHFPYLESLHLGDGMYSRQITTVLRQHPTLRKLHLGQGGHGVIEYLDETIENKTSSLEQIILDCIPNNSFLRGDPARTRFYSLDYSEKAPDLRQDGWYPPDKAFDSINLEYLDYLIDDARENGIRLSGTLIDGYDYHGDWTVEWDNRDEHNLVSGWHVGIESRLRALDWRLTIGPMEEEITSAEDSEIGDSETEDSETGESSDELEDE
ncbi:hypothetical protein JCM5353_007459 [Sporobolomyces roseus]